ncbi:ABC transporter permease [Streptomyces montanisoli]|uniref:ABC transporter permease n=1 Tax=Streptomyces montanisoli TaxID=2798581 RepID=A0A940M6Z5_9ACTN|nr:ABC transporter permease [Streptomyces montanisoli]MBP0457334.1 ABC transporter permease [Streptomyces montanisoli]
MIEFILRRTGAAVITLFLASIAVFLGVRALPGDPATVLAGESPTPQVVAAIRKQFGLDQPLPVQYLHYMGQALQGNLGSSTQDKAPVTQVLGERLPVTLELTFLAILVGVLVGVLAGIVSAVRRGTALDYAANGFGLFGLSVPHFWLGLLGIVVFSVHWHILPASGFVGLADDPVGNLERMVMPVLVLGLGLAAVVMRQTRSSLLSQLGADYVRTARSKGLSRGQQIRHALRNSLTTVTTVVGLQLAGLISGAVITEQIFVIPGFGKLIVDGVSSRNYPVIQGAVLVTVAGYVVINLLVDVAYAYLDPRLRMAGGSQ